MNNIDSIEEIKKLKEEKNAVIVAHYYQRDEIQQIADIVGDSFALSKFCAESDKDTIVFCGVHFMAESAKILSPHKTVLLPEINAGCPMADMVTVGSLQKMKDKYPQAAVVCYINSSAEVKAKSDICCTSSNAVKIVKSLPQKDIIFVPDQNLGSFVAEKVPEKNIILWEGYCITHHRVSEDEVKKIKQLHPDAIVLVHPECKNEVVKHADFVGSTKQIIEYAKKSINTKFIIGTEMGIMYQLKRDNPDKTFYLLSQGFICVNMKKTSIQSVYLALKNNQYEIKLDDDTINSAKACLEKMLKV